VQKAWDLLLEKQSTVALDFTSLQARSLLPTKNHVQDCLMGAPLQLAGRTFLTIDETVLTEGQLNQQGIENLSQLQNILESQKVKYDFHYHHLDVDTDYPSIVFSNSKSLFNAYCCGVPLSPDAGDHDVHVLCSKAQEDPKLLGRWRRLLLQAQPRPYTITDQIKDAVEQDIEREMATRPQRFNKSSVVQHNTLHTWFTVARLLSLSKGESELSFETWQSMKVLEDERHQRLASFGAHQGK
jgi:hypothetical protein